MPLRCADATGLEALLAARHTLLQSKVPLTVVVVTTLSGLVGFLQMYLERQPAVQLFLLPRQAYHLLVTSGMLEIVSAMVCCDAVSSDQFFPEKSGS